MLGRPPVFFPESSAGIGIPAELLALLQPPQLGAFMEWAHLFSTVSAAQAGSGGEAQTPNPRH